MYCLLKGTKPVSPIVHYSLLLILDLLTLLYTYPSQGICPYMVVGATDYKSSQVTNTQACERCCLGNMNVLVVLCAQLYLATALKEDAGAPKNVKYS